MTPQQATATTTPDGIIRVPLADHIILATDEHGDELLCITVQWGGDTEVRFRFPRLGDWDNFYLGLYKILSYFAQHAPDVDLPDLLEAKDENGVSWRLLWRSTATLFKRRAVRKEIEHILSFLRPEVENLKSGRQTIRYLRKHAPADGLLRLFLAILAVDQWYEKKTIQGMMKIFRWPISPASQDPSTNPSGGHSMKAEAFRSSEFVAF